MALTLTAWMSRERHPACVYARLLIVSCEDRQLRIIKNKLFMMKCLSEVLTLSLRAHDVEFVFVSSIVYFSVINTGFLISTGCVTCVRRHVKMIVSFF